MTVGEDHGERVRFGGALGAIVAEAHRVAGRYHQGASVDVYYSPSRPSVATLERRIVTVPLGVVLFIIGVALTLYFYKQANQSAQSWPTVQGRVTDLEVREVKYRDELSDSKVTTYRPFVAYSYQRDGKPFAQRTVKVFTASGRATTREQCVEVVNRFRPDDGIELCVSPVDPSISVVDPEPPASGMIAVLACAVLPLLGIFIAADAYYRFWYTVSEEASRRA